MPQRTRRRNSTCKAPKAGPYTSSDVMLDVLFVRRRVFWPPINSDLSPGTVISISGAVLVSENLLIYSLYFPRLAHNSTSPDFRLGRCRVRWHRHAEINCFVDPSAAIYSVVMRVWFVSWSFLGCRWLFVPNVLHTLYFKFISKHFWKVNVSVSV